MKTQFSSTNKKDIRQILRTLREVSFPVGFSDFKQMVTKTNIFVDKTLFIKQIIDIKDKVILITRPRRWGKTLNMSMLKYFFNKELDQNGRPLDPQPHRALFEGQKTKESQVERQLRGPLKIVKDSYTQWISRYSKHQCRYPVISISFRAIHPRTFLQAKKKIFQAIGQAFNSHCYLRDKNFRYWIQQFDKISKNDKNKLVEIDLAQILKQLSELLRNYHEQRVYILIDNYDSPIKFMLFEQMRAQDIKQKKRICQERKKVIQMIDEILSFALKDNINLQKGILTGIFDTIDRSTESCLNNITLCRITDQQYQQFYGFSQKEIEDELIQKLFKNPDQISNEEYKNEFMRMIKNQYDGYVVPVRSSYMKIYNPDSVIRYLKQSIYHQKILKGEPFWKQTGSNLLIQQFFSFQNKYNQIPRVLALNTKYPTAMYYDRRVQLTKLNFSKENDEDQLTYLLINGGYLTGRINEKRLQALIPNKQLFKTFRSKFFDWAGENWFVSNQSPINLEDFKQLRKKMQETLDRTKDNISRKNQQFFNRLFTLRYLFSNNYAHILSVDWSSSLGCLNNILYPDVEKVNQCKSDAAIIHQYKYTLNPQDQQKSYDEALWQIYEKGYIQQIIDRAQTQHHIKTIIARPIVIVFNTITNTTALYMKKDRIHSIEMAKKINQFFKDEKTLKILGLNNKQRNINSSRMALLKEKSVQNLEDLLRDFNQLQETKEQNKNLYQITLKQKESRKRFPQIDLDEDKPKSSPPFI